MGSASVVGPRLDDDPPFFSEGVEKLDLEVSHWLRLRLPSFDVLDRMPGRAQCNEERRELVKRAPKKRQRYPLPSCCCASLAAACTLTGCHLGSKN